MEDNQQNNMLFEKQPTSAKSPKPIVRIVLSLVILVVGIGAASYLKNSAPRTRKRPPAKLSPTVLIQTVKPSGYQIIVTAMGTVIPAQEVVLKSRVSGEIIEIHPEFTEGGFLRKNMKVLQIDPLDYELALERQISAAPPVLIGAALAIGFLVIVIGRPQLSASDSSGSVSELSSSGSVSELWGPCCAVIGQ